MKKRFLGILLCLCIVLSLMPATVFAEETTYNLWIGGENFTSGKTTISVGGGTATFNPDSSKLTLSNITLSYSKASMAAIQSDIKDLEIELIGTNTININSDGMAGIWLDSSSKATITGTAGSKLIINSVGKENMGITTGSGVSLTMNNTNLTVNDNTTAAAAKGYMVGLKLGGDLTMTGGSYTAAGVQNGIEMYTNCDANLSGVSFNISCTPRQSFSSTIPNEMSIGLCLAPLPTGRQNVITNCSGSISAHYPLYTDGVTALNSSNNLTLTTDNYDAVYANADLTVSGGTLNLTSTGSSGSGFSVLESSQLVFDGSPNVTVNVGYVAVTWSATLRLQRSKAVR